MFPWVLVDNAAESLYSCQRIARTPSGRIWLAEVIVPAVGAGEGVVAWYSDDNGATWTGETVIAINPANDFFDSPNLVADATGQIFLTFYGGIPAVPAGLNVYLFIRSVAGVWSGPTAVGVNAGNNQPATASPVITVDGSDVIHLAWRQYDSGLRLSTLRHRTIVGGVLQPAEDVYANGANGVIWWSDIRVDSAGNIYILFVGKPAAQFLLYYVKKDVAWNAPVPVTVAGQDYLTLHGAYAWRQMSMLIDPSDNLHFSYAGYSTLHQAPLNPNVQQIMYRYLSAGGVWADAIPLTDVPDILPFGFYNSITLSKDDHLHILARMTGVSSNPLLTAPVEIENIGGVWQPPVSLDDTNVIVGFQGTYDDNYPKSGGASLRPATGFNVTVSDAADFNMYYGAPAPAPPARPRYLGDVHVDQLRYQKVERWNEQNQQW